MTASTPSSARRELKIGYKASAEQFDPQRLASYAVLAEEVGLDTVTISDHFQPWRVTGGHIAPQAELRGLDADTARGMTLAQIAVAKAGRESASD